MAGAVKSNISHVDSVDPGQSVRARPNLRGNSEKCCFSDGIKHDAACQSLTGCTNFCHGLWHDCDALVESMEVAPKVSSEDQQYCCFSDGIKHDDTCQSLTGCTNFCHGLWKPCQSGAQLVVMAGAVKGNLSHISSADPRQSVRTRPNLRGNSEKCCFSDGIKHDAACQSLTGCTNFCHGLWRDCDVLVEPMER